jgi:hypothetical protein
MISLPIRPIISAFRLSDNNNGMNAEPPVARFQAEHQPRRPVMPNVMPLAEMAAVCRMSIHQHGEFGHALLFEQLAR